MASGEPIRLGERELAQALTSLPDGVVVLDHRIEVRWVNERFTRLTGWEPEEVIGRNGLDMVDPQQLQEAIEALAITAEQEVLPPGDYALMHRDGGYVSFEMHAAPLDPSRQDSLIVLMLRPIDHQRLLNDGVELLNAGGPIEEMAHFVVHRIGWPAGPLAVAFDDDTDHRLRCSVSSGLPQLLDGTTTVGDGSAPWEDAISTGEMVHRSIDDLPPSISAEASRRGLVACTAVPVPDPGGRDGVIVLWFDDGAPSTYRFLFRQEPRYLLLRLALERRHYLRALRTAAVNDHLTGLANRRHFFDVVEGADKGSRCAALYLDLDNFKPINDTLGHLMGDAVLAEIGVRIRRNVRPSDIAARLGGDEFAVFCTKDVNLGEIEHLCGQLHRAITQPITMPDGPVRVGASIGAAVAAHAGVVPLNLVEEADQMLYELKRDGKDGWRSSIVD